MKIQLNKKRLEYAKFLILRLPHSVENLKKVFPKHFGRWVKIDRKKDKSYSASDFRFWLYLRLLDKNYPMEVRGIKNE